MADDVLYDDGKVKVSYFKDLVDEHVLHIGDQGFILQRGILEELARTPISSIRSKLSAIDPNIDSALLLANIFYHEIDFALKQTRIRELETQVNELARKIPLPHYLPKIIPVPK